MNVFTLIMSVMLLLRVPCVAAFTVGLNCKSEKRNTKFHCKYYILNVLVLKKIHLDVIKILERNLLVMVIKLRSSI